MSASELKARVHINVSNINKLLRAVTVLRALPMPKAMRAWLLTLACQRWPIYVQMHDGRRLSQRTALNMLDWLERR
jgi:hypothetical protein